MQEPVNIGVYYLSPENKYILLLDTCEHLNKNILSRVLEM